MTVDGDSWALKAPPLPARTKIVKLSLKALTLFIILTELKGTFIITNTIKPGSVRSQL